MKKYLLLMMAIATVALSSSATKIYVCGTKITGTTSFSAGGGTVSYDADSKKLTITNVDYTKNGSSNNGISVDEVDAGYGYLSIELNGTVKFTIGDADAVLCKDSNKKDIYIKVNGNATFTTKSSSHAGLKLQDCSVFLTGPGTLNINNTSSGSSGCAIKGGTGNENLDIDMKKCTLSSNGVRLYKLKNVYFRKYGVYDTGDYSTRSTLITFKHGSSNTVHAKDITQIWSYISLFTPIEYYHKGVDYYLTSTIVANKDMELSDYVPAVIINDSKFPDANLYSHLRYLEPQGWLTTTAMNAYTYLDISGMNISNLEGLSQFANLKELRCNNNNLTNLYGLPTSSIQTLNCSNNKITSFNYLQNCNSLKTLNCSSNQISSLNNLPTNIESLNCSSNKFTSLDFDDHYSWDPSIHYGTKYLSLRNLDCSNNSYLTEIYNNYDGSSTAALASLNVSGCTSLTKIICTYSKLTSISSLPSSLKTLNLHGNQFTSTPSLPSGLEYLTFSNNKLTSFTLSNHSNIKYISIGSNPLTSLTINNNSMLGSVYAYYIASSCTINCNNNSKLTVMNVEESTGLKILNCYGNTALTSLPVTGCTAMTTLDCHGNALTGIGNLNNCTALTSIQCYNNKITSLDVSSLSNLTELICRQNNLTSLNVSNKTKLTKLYAYMNKLTSLNVQGCSALNDLDVNSNNLTSLSVQGCNALRTLNCCVNKITASGANTLINSLCTIPSGSQGVLKYIYPGYTSSNYNEGNVSLTAAQIQTARNKRWYPKKIVNGSWVDIPVSVPGDVNGDGQVTAADITALYDVLLNNNYSQVVNGDQTGDGIITAADVTAVYTIMLSSKE